METGHKMSSILTAESESRRITLITTHSDANFAGLLAGPESCRFSANTLYPCSHHPLVHCSRDCCLKTVFKDAFGPELEFHKVC